MKTILVTGASGYIGKHVIAALNNQDIRVIGLSRTEPNDNLGIDYIKGDIFDGTDAILSLDTPIDACLHLAWGEGFVHNSPSHLLNFSAHYKFLKELMDAQIPKIAVMGTMHEVGYWEGAIDENTPCNPLSLYGIAKNSLRSALLLDAQNSNTAIQWLRGYYIYGDDEQSHSIFGKLYRAAKSGETTFPFNSGKNKYDFIRIEDLAEQIAACVLQDEVTGIINCCSGKPVSIGEQIENFIADNNLQIELLYNSFPERPYDSPAVWGNNTKIMQILEA